MRTPLYSPVRLIISLMRVIWICVLRRDVKHRKNFDKNQRIETILWWSERPYHTSGQYVAVSVAFDVQKISHVGPPVLAGWALFGRDLPLFSPEMIWSPTWKRNGP